MNTNGWRSRPVYPPALIRSMRGDGGFLRLVFAPAPSSTPLWRSEAWGRGQLRGRRAVPGADAAEPRRDGVRLRGSRPRERRRLPTGPPPSTPPSRLLTHPNFRFVQLPKGSPTLACSDSLAPAVRQLSWGQTRRADRLCGPLPNPYGRTCFL